MSFVIGGAILTLLAAGILGTLRWEMHIAMRTDMPGSPVWSHNVLYSCQRCIALHDDCDAMSLLALVEQGQQYRLTNSSWKCFAATRRALAPSTATAGAAT